MNKYDRNRLQELERKHQKGTLDDEMYPYYQWLAGDRTKSSYETQWHTKAREIIVRLKKNRSTKQVAEITGTYYSFVHRLIHSEFHKVPEGKCKRIVEEFG